MYNIVETIKQSPPLDPTAPYDEASGLAGKTIVITGGASGFGAAFARRWTPRHRTTRRRGWRGRRS